jgi:crotonobetainyl-CoA:carnitine CoA-transferase CaiB-like acyl-CoA transferase
VIRVEAPGGGDIARTNPPFVGADGLSFGAKADNEIADDPQPRAQQEEHHAGPQDRQGPRDLMARRQYDVLIENMSEGTPARLKVDYGASGARTESSTRRSRRSASRIPTRA